MSIPNYPSILRQTDQREGMFCYDKILKQVTNVTCDRYPKAVRQRAVELDIGLCAYPSKCTRDDKR